MRLLQNEDNSVTIVNAQLVEEELLVGLIATFPFTPSEAIVRWEGQRFRVKLPPSLVGQPGMVSQADIKLTLLPL
jgi:hypothetical protein